MIGFGTRRRAMRLLHLLAATGCALAALLALHGAAARAAVFTQTYSTPGTYTLTVPAGFFSLNLTASGGAGNNGSPSATNASAGGAGGTAGGASATYDTTSSVAGGDALSIVVGAQGGGGAGGAGDGQGGAGGAGGGASTVIDTKAQAAVFVANSGDNAVTSYTVGATGDARPLTAIAGSATTLSGLGSVAVDRNGTVRRLLRQRGDRRVHDDLKRQHRTRRGHPGRRHAPACPGRRVGPPVRRRSRRVGDHRVHPRRERRRQADRHDLRT